MYGEILDGKITHYRGDTLSTPIFIYEGDRLCPIPYTLKDTDKLYLGIMEPEQSFEDAIVKKVYTNQSDKTANGEVLFNLKSEDTEYLSPGTYYYMLKLEQVVNGNTIITTIIKPTIFWLLGNIPEVKPLVPEIVCEILTKDITNAMESIEPGRELIDGLYTIQSVSYSYGDQSTGKGQRVVINTGDRLTIHISDVEAVEWLTVGTLLYPKFEKVFNNIGEELYQRGKNCKVLKPIPKEEIYIRRK